MALPSSGDKFAFLNGGGEMGRLVRAFNWSGNPLGDPAAWPQSLKTTLSIILNSKFPMFLFWGPEMICFYNDAYRPSLGAEGKHPAMLGSYAVDSWQEIWNNIKPIIDQVLAGGEANWNEDQLLPIYRNGRLEDVYWTFSYSPVSDETGKPVGVFVTCTETTSKVFAVQNLSRANKLLHAAKEADDIARRKLKENEQNLKQVILQAPVAIAIFRGADFVVEIANGKALELWGRTEDEVINKPILQVLTELESQGVKELLDDVYYNGNPFSASALPITLRRGGEMRTAYVDFVYDPLYDTEGKINRVITIGSDVTQQVLARKAIEESEERFRTMAEGTDVLIAVADESSNATYFNTAWETVTGKSVQNFMNYGWMDIVHPDDRESYTNLYKNAFAKREPFTGEFRILGYEGQYHWFLGHGAPRVNADGSFAGYISSNVDITKRKIDELEISRQQKELQDSEAKLDQIITQLPSPVVVLHGPDQVVKTTNDALLSFWNKTRDEVIGKPMLEIFPELKRQRFPAQWKRVYETGESIANRETPVTFFTGDGSTRLYYVDYHYKALRDSDGNIESVLATVIDVTDKVESRTTIENIANELHSMNQELGASNEELVTTNEELSETQENLQRVIGQLSDSEAKLLQSINTGRMGTWGIDPLTYELRLSGFVRDLFGLPMDGPVDTAEMIGAVDQDYHKAIRAGYEDAMLRHLPSDMEYPVTNKLSGEIKWVRATGQVFLNGIGEVIEYSGMIMDITEHKLDELRKSDFIGMVSHELKTPLTTLTAIVQVLNSKLKNSEDAFISGALDKANVQVRKMSTMINGFLNISRLESGKIVLSLQPFDMKQLLIEAIDEIRLTTHSHEFTLQSCDPVIIKADRDKIGSVISNLLSNAVKYSPKGEQVTINCLIEGENIKISVTDDGIGIRPEDTKHLFERYYRVESNKTRHISGFGIGLYLSAEIINRHGGTIWVNSEIGRGSTFYFTLPLDMQTETS